MKGQDYEAYSKVYRKILHEIAQKDFDKALIAADSLHKTTVLPAYKVCSLLLIATLYQQKNNIEKAISYAEKAEDTVEYTDDYAWQARVYGFLASQYRLIKLYSKFRYLIINTSTWRKKVLKKLKKDSLKVYWYM
ncbi:hypothetical protein [Elizabethkingia miricola]|nr:hypothetical protein [Elizabethkingia miricola]UIO95669.1 hypothetical protein LYZ41_15870 [Elizabethkingia miricola]WER12458.1 hypothetical protein P0M31_15620 [Elizabethkingia miricola]WNG64427.1 hypothetical protein M9H57_15930 [Elizabethkingia miricola]